MKKSYLLIIVALLLVLTASATRSEASNLNIGFHFPAYGLAAPPELVVIPGTYVYAVPNIAVDVLFYQGYWWRPYEGRWYRSRDYKGGYHYVEPRRVPRGLRALPHDYRHRLLRGYERISHRDVQRNWSKWEKEKYWDKRREHGHTGHYDGAQRGRDRADRHNDRRNFNHR